MTTAGSSAPKTPKADRALVDASDEARSALVEVVGEGGFGEHVGSTTEAERVVTHLFAATDPGYAGWRWAVTLARAPRQKSVTIDEIVLLPGGEALVAPAWVPWEERVAPDDLGPGDLIPVSDEDPRLVPGYLGGDQALDSASSRDLREVIRELGLGRTRVLSVTGRDEAADRWYDGASGPHSAIAESAPAHCASCGFLVRVAGPLGTMFGVCANASSPSDGRAVAMDHGCGAHSDVRVQVSPHQPSTPLPFHDTVTWDSFAEADLELLT
ncbi:MAG: DUF3027 domain-containing protein [Nocardioidaceae bacterium]